MRFLRLIVLALSMILMFTGTSQGSLGQGHIYVAEKLLAKMPTQLKILVENEKSAYLAGANGVDIVSWAYYKAHFTNSNLPNVPPKPFDLHTNTSTYNAGEKALEILDESKKYSMKEKAFAVGWLTHWLVDAYVHTLIGHYGGDYRDDEDENTCTPTGSCRHTQLEIAESKHLCSSDKYKTYHSILKAYKLSKEDMPEDFIEELFKNRKFAPSNHPDGYMQGSITKRPPLFFGLPGASNLDMGRAFVHSAIECCQLSCLTGRNDCDGTKTGNVALMAWENSKQSYLLSNTDYSDIKNAIGINLDKLKVTDGSLHAEIEVNDTQLYGKFLVEWDRVISELEKFVDEVQLFHIVQAFLGPAEVDPAEEKAKEALQGVLNQIPNILTPRNQMYLLDRKTTKRYADGTLRGAPDIKGIAYEIASTCDGGKTFNPLLYGTVPISFHDPQKQRIKLFGSKSGSAVINATLGGDDDKACQYVLLVSLVNPETGQGSYMLGTVKDGGVGRVNVFTRNPTAPADPEFKQLEYDWVSGDYRKSSDLKSRAEAKYKWMQNIVPYLERLIELDEREFSDLEKAVRKDVLGGVASGKYGAPPVPQECKGKSAAEMEERIREIERVLPNHYRCGNDAVEDPLTKEKRWGCTEDAQYRKLASERRILEFCLKGRDAVTYWELKCIDTPARERWEHKVMLNTKLAAAKESKAYERFKEYAAWNDYGGYLKETEKVKKELNLPDPIPSPAVLPWTYSSPCGVGGALKEAGKLEIQLKKNPEKPSYIVGEKVTLTAAAAGGKAPYSYEWTGDCEGKDASATCLLSKAGQNRVQVKVKDGEGTAGEASMSVEVAKLQIELNVDPKEPYVGQELKAKLTVKPEVKEIDFRWMPVPDNAKQSMESKDGREITFYLKDDKPAEIKVNARVPKSGEDLGEAKNTVKAKKYAVNVTGPKAMGPKPRVWKEGVGLVDVENAIAVDQIVEFAADTQPAALTGPVKYQWTVSSGSCTVSNPTSREARATTGSAGGCELTVAVRDKNDVPLGEGKGSFSATITREAIASGQKKAKDAADAKAKVQAAREEVRLGKLDEAIADLDAAVKLDPANREAAATAQKLRQEKETIHRQLDRAKKLMEENRFADASRELIVASNINSNYPPVQQANREQSDRQRAYDNGVQGKIREVRAASEQKEFGRAIEIAAAWRASTKLDPNAESALRQQEDYARQMKARKDRQISILKQACEMTRHYDYAGAVKGFKEGFADAQSLFNGREPEYQEAVKLRNEAYAKNQRLQELIPWVRKAAEGRETMTVDALQNSLKTADEAVALQPTNEHLTAWRAMIVSRVATTKADNERSAQGRKYLNAARSAENSFLSMDSSMRSGPSPRWDENTEMTMQGFLVKAVENYRESLKYIPDAAVEKHIRELEANLEARKKFLENVRLSKRLRAEGDQLAREARSETSFEASQEKFTRAIELYTRSLGLYQPPDVQILQQTVSVLGMEKLSRAYKKHHADCVSLAQAGRIAEALAACERAAACRYPHLSQHEWWQLEEGTRSLRNQLDSAKRWRAQGEAEERAGKIAAAVTSYRNSLKNVPDAALEQHVRKLEAGLAGKGTADRLWQEGTGLYGQGQYDAALGKFKESLGQWSDATRSNFVRDLESRRARAKQLVSEGEALQQKRQLQAAVGKYRESLTYWPDKQMEDRIQQLEKQIAFVPPVVPPTPPQPPGPAVYPAYLTSKVWQFGRSDGTVLAANMRLMPDGRIEGSAHSNESRWAYVNEKLIFYDSDGRVATRYNSFRKEGGRWVISGPFLLWGDITHVLKEVGDLSRQAPVRTGAATTSTAASSLPKPEPPPQTKCDVNISGTWVSNINVEYTIQQTGCRFSWNLKRYDETCEGTIDGRVISARYSGRQGTASVRGTVSRYDSAGRPLTIKWEDGSTFNRRP